MINDDWTWDTAMKVFTILIAALVLSACGPTESERLRFEYSPICVAWAPAENWSGKVCTEYKTKKELQEVKQSEEATKEQS